MFVGVKSGVETNQLKWYNNKRQILIEETIVNINTYEITIRLKRQIYN